MTYGITWLSDGDTVRPLVATTRRVVVVRYDPMGYLLAHLIGCGDPLVSDWGMKLAAGDQE